MVKKAVEEAPNVVTEEYFRDLFSRGYDVDVLALEDAEKRSSYWHGVWAVRIVSPDGDDDRLLVVSRKSLDTRLFKTANGILSFIFDLGFETAKIPRFKGGRAKHRSETDLPKPR